MSNISRSQAKRVNDAIREAANEILAKEGLQVTKTNGSYGDFGRVKIEYGPVDAETGMAMGKAQLDWLDQAWTYGFDADDLGAKFATRKGEPMYEVVGLNTRAPKYPIQIRRVADGRNMKAPVSMVLNAKNHGVWEPKND